MSLQNNVRKFTVTVIWAIFLLHALASYGQSGTWITKAPIPTARAGMAGATLEDGRILVVGGDYGSITNRSSDLEIYDPVTNSWSVGADMPTPRAGLGAGVIDGKLYVPGGCCLYNILEIYDPISNSWTTGSPMSTERGGHGVGVIDGKLYVVGGGAVEGSEGSLEVYDPATNNWSLKAPMPTPRYNLSASVIDGKLYAVGGQNASDGTAVPILEVYDPITDTWSTKASMHIPRHAFDTAVVNGVLYAIQNDVEAYYPENDSWERLGPIPTDRSTSAVVASGETIFVIGGNTNSGVTSVVEAFIPPPAPSRPTICSTYDSFDGDAIDLSLWWSYGSSEIFTQSDGFLHADSPANLTSAVLKSRSAFSGDFDFILEYNYFQTTAGLGDDNWPQISLSVSSGAQGENFAYIFKTVSGDYWNKFISNAYFNGEWQSHGDGEDGTKTYGFIRIKRTGSNIRTFYNENTGNEWTPVGNYSNIFAGPVNVEISVSTGTGGTFHVSSEGLYDDKCLALAISLMKILVNNSEVIAVDINDDKVDLIDVIYAIQKAANLRN